MHKSLSFFSLTARGGGGENFAGIYFRGKISSLRKGAKFSPGEVTSAAAATPRPRSLCRSTDTQASPTPRPCIPGPTQTPSEDTVVMVRVVPLPRNHNGFRRFCGSMKMAISKSLLELGASPPLHPRAPRPHSSSTLKCWSSMSAPLLASSTASRSRVRNVGTPATGMAVRCHEKYCPCARACTLGACSIRCRAASSSMSARTRSSAARSPASPGPTGTKASVLKSPSAVARSPQKMGMAPARNASNTVSVTYPGLETSSNAITKVYFAKSAARAPCRPPLRDAAFAMQEPRASQPWENEGLTP